MGADIHIYAEKKLKNGDWSTFSTFPTISLRAYGVPVEEGKSDTAWSAVGNRDYGFFAALAGVRGHGPEPLGIPDDVSPLVLEEYEGWGEDAHSASWSSAEEFLAIYLEHKFPEEAVQLVGGHTTKERLIYQHFGMDVWDEYSTIDHYRFVFWFDN
jgi:hypothetical protein